MRTLRSVSLLAASSLLVAGCGLGADPVVQSEGEVLDALLALGAGAEARVTATLDHDTDELRGVLRADPEARALLEDRLGTTDVDDLLEALADLEDELADHALVLASGSDGSTRLAAEYRDRVWLDLRRSSATDGDGSIELQARVDWTTLGEVAEAPDLGDQLDEAVAALAPFLGDLPETQRVQDVLLGLVAGDLVALDGELDDALVDLLTGRLGAGDLDVTALEDLQLPPRELLDTALAFDGFRRDGDDTLVDVHLELRAAATLVLDTVAAAAAAGGLAADDLADARTAVAALPARLDGVATVRLDRDGAVDQVRADLLDVAVQLARAASPDDEEVAVATRVADQLDDTGLFVLLDVTSIGATPTVLGDPVASASPAEVTAALSRLLFGGLAGGIDPAALQDLLDEAPTG